MRIAIVFFKKAKTRQFSLLWVYKNEWQYTVFFSYVLMFGQALMLEWVAVFTASWFRLQHIITLRLGKR